MKLVKNNLLEPSSKKQTQDLLSLPFQIHQEFLISDGVIPIKSMITPTYFIILKKN